MTGSTKQNRMPHDLSSFIFTTGQIGRIQTLNTTLVLPGDSFEQNLVGSLKLGTMRRGLSIDSKIDVYSFYVPHRHIYGDKWLKLIKDGAGAAPITDMDTWTPDHAHKVAYLGVNTAQRVQDVLTTPSWLIGGYYRIYNNWFKAPWHADEALTTEPTETTGAYGLAAARIPAVWQQQLPPERGGRTMDLPIDAQAEKATLNLQTLKANYGELATEQQRELFTTRYRDIISAAGGHTHEDADSRPKLLMRSSQWASGSNVKGTDQATLGSHVGQVDQRIQHSVPRFFVPEHGTIWTVAVVRFPSIHALEQHLAVRKSEQSYRVMAGDPHIMQHQPRATVSNDDFFPEGNTSLQRQIPYGQWFRYNPNTIHPNYTRAQGYPFQVRQPYSDRDLFYVNNEDFHSMFVSTMMGHFEIHAKNNVTVLRNLPTARDAIVTGTS